MLSKMITTKQWRSSHRHPYTSTTRRLWKRLSPFPASQKQFIQKNFFYKLQLTTLLLQRKPTPNSIDHALKIHSAINNSISDNLENSMKSIIFKIYCYWKLSAMCYDKDRKELSRWYCLNSNWWNQRPLCINKWFDFCARCHRNYQNPEKVGEPLRRELCFSFPVEQTTGLIVLRKRMFSVAVDQLFSAKKKIHAG